MSKKHVFLRVFSKIAIFACVFCTFFISPVFANLPAGYTELEYIESTETQYIDTGIDVVRGQNVTSEIDMQFTTTTGKSTQYTGTYGGLYFGIHSGNFEIGAVSGSGTVADTNRHRFIYNGTAGLSPTTLTLTIDGMSYNVSRNTAAGKIFLLSIDQTPITYALYAKVFFAKYYIDNTLVREFIPAKRNSDNIVGMYDLVSGTFFENAGTGDFIAGPVIEIKIATTKYVETEFAPLDTALANAISVVDNVVTQTIAQAGQIATLQNTKQTRPSDDDECPANMKCLLVTDESGTPHWYPIIEP